MHTIPPQPKRFHYLFGPVPSRRLGRSLGVDLVPHKTCTLNCVYCECGKTTHLTTKRGVYVPLDEVVRELKTLLASGPEIDYITFSGAGEPTLHEQFGELLLFLKTDYPRYKTALLTNGTLFHEESVQFDASGFDKVMASIDAATIEAFQAVNRPCAGIELAAIIEGLRQFRQICQGELWIEVFMVPGLNTASVELIPIRQAITAIHPHGVQVNTLDRPGTENWVKPAGQTIIDAVCAFLGNAQPIQPPPPRPEYAGETDDVQALVIRTAGRRPLTAGDVAEITGLQRQKVDRLLDFMVSHQLLQIRVMPRGTFYSSR